MMPLVATTLTVTGLALAGCSSEPLADTAANSANIGFVVGDGATTSIPVAERTEPVEFSGADDAGNTISAADFRGSVTVVNFWYAGCAPCRAEAPDINGAVATLQAEGVKFLGVNTRDQAAQAAQFEEEFGVPYPSIMDAAGGRSVQAAFAGQVPLNAVPTTLVLDREGRVAHRVVGQLASQSQLETLVKETLQEAANQ
ncbi:TlpA family protein disulfide reductase [Leucobacter sp. OH2974_COT-288]|nr:TlpA family protein disulfide reductase [Leucobacter sp. OH2974_COT-288]